jgi:glycosyltransferase involved in cell wall biosynthesis
VHIAFVTTESPYENLAGCGVAAYLRAIIPAIAGAGHRVSVIANAKEEKTFNAENGRVVVHHFRLPSWHWYSAKLPLVRNFASLPLRQLEWSLAFYREAARVATTTKIDVIESTEIGALLLHRIAPLVIRLHGSERTFREHSGRRVNASVRWNDALEAISCERAKVITAPSKFHANESAKRRGWTADRVRVIPNPISGKLLKAALKFERNGTAERIVLYTGRLAPVKGVETLLEAAKLVHGKDRSVIFVLAGPWQMPNSPEAYGLHLNRESAFGVLWVGPQSEDELISWYERATSFVMPSYFESFGISVIEAMAFGLPAVCTRAGGIPETVDDGVTGMLVEPGDSAYLADTILQLLSDSQQRGRLGLAGRKKNFEKFQPANIARQTLEVYHEVRESFSSSRK